MVITDQVIDPIADGLEIWIWENPASIMVFQIIIFMVGSFYRYLYFIYYLSQNDIHLINRAISNLVISFFSIIYY